jgi:DNA-binding transcriptional regulator YiaG
MTGKEVESLRKRLGVTPKELADLLGVSRSAVYRWEYVDEPRIDPGSLRILSLLNRFDGSRTT